MLFKRNRPRRIIAAALMMLMLSNIILPVAAYALTSGPTAPEATSFEPVDTSDMVNLSTGDLTYNIPLLEVPGPEGGYPLSLSYHAGIQPDMDASWVGLGWSLNPGAISRSVNGYPDDYSRVRQTKRDFWVGGTTTTYQFGVSVGLAGSPASVSAGLSVATDTYKGFGVGVDVGVGVFYGPVGLGVSAGINPYGGGYAGLSASIGTGVPVGSGMALGLQGSVSLSTNFKSINADASGGVGLSYSQSVDGYSKPLTHSILGASIGSNSNKPSLSAGGGTASVGNSKTGDISTSSSGFGIGVPITPVFGVYLGMRKQRYWSDETINVYTNGALNMTFAQPTTGGSNSGFYENAYDTYHLYDNANYNIGANPDPRIALGGTFPDNDFYNVTAQGLGGTIRPYVFKEEVYIQNDRFDATRDVQQYVPAGVNNPPQFQNPMWTQYRFTNDFSNRYLQTHKNFAYTSDNWIYPVFDNAPTYGLNDGTYGYNASRQALAGSRNVEYIHNINMLPGSSHTNGTSLERFYDPVAQGFVRRGALSGTESEVNFNYQIGGYKITNESGMTFHYMLPAYAGSEYVYNRVKNSDATFNMLKKDASYAYAWYLTGVTGPDYVDANNNLKIDEGDWGYWVSFEYGKWCDDFIWRNPSEGYQSDLDNDFEMQAAGKKELYYLNKIKTRTHTAIFQKSVRMDGKGISTTTTNSQYGNYPLYNGGFSASSKSTLRLDKVLLFNNDDAALLTPTGGTALSGHYIQNVYDAQDISPASAIKALRVVGFSYDYSLCPWTSNSFDNANVNAKLGKLTLKSLYYLGSNGFGSLPPITFNYELEGTDKQQATMTSSGTNVIIGTNNFAIGDILQITNAGSTYYAVVLSKSGTSCTLKYIATINPASGLSVVATTTKNPPYGKDNNDIWNMYKSDFDVARLAYGTNTAKAASPISTRSVDVWSLRSVISSIGSKIKLEYEGDSYRNAVVDQGYKIQIVDNPGTGAPGTGFYFNSNTDSRFYYTVVNPELLDRNNLKVGDKFDAILFWHRLGNTPCGALPGGFCVIDTKAKGNSYLEVVDLTYFATNNTIGFKFYNVHEYDAAGNGTCEFINTFPTPTNPGCYHMPDIGNLRIMSAINNKPGGNLRVKSISIVNMGDNRQQRTTYDYSLPSNPDITSGVTSFEPTVFDDASFIGFPNTADERKAYKAKLYQYNSQTISFTREMPPPGVMYEFVTIRNEIVNPEETIKRQIEGKTIYEFEVFNEKMIGVKEISKSGPSPYPGDANPTYNTIETRLLALKNFTAIVGNVKRITRYDNLNSKLSETVNTYLSDRTTSGSFENFANAYEQQMVDYKNQGVLKENFINVRLVKGRGYTELGARKAVNSMREEYPSILTEQTSSDYITKTQTSSKNLEFDFYSGALTKKLYVDAYGNRILSESVPAYKKYSSSLGLKFSNNFSKNMLTQTAEEYVYKVDASNTKLGLVSANVTTWANTVPALNMSGSSITQNTDNTTQGNVWRPQYNYSWMPVNKTTDNLTPIGSFVDFNFTTPSSSNANWKKISEATLYDTYSKALEATDINGNYIATRMNNQSKKVELNGSPAKYYEIAYSGVEDANINQTANGFVKKVDGTVVNTAGVAHTGSKSLKLGISGKKGLVYTIECNKLTPGRDYMASVWVKPVSGTASDVKLYYDKGGAALGNSVSSGSSTKSAGSWKLINVKINGSDVTAGATINIGCRNDHASAEAYVDDFRFQPLNAASTAYVYDTNTGELTYILGNNNVYTRFEYDAGGRLIATYKEKLGVGEFKINEYQYNYWANIYISNAINNVTYIKNDCPSGQEGTSVQITVPLGKFTSSVSAYEANAMARAYAQSEANRLGTCNTSTNVNVTLQNYISSSVYTPTFVNQVEFLQDNIVKYTYTWPSGAGNNMASTNVTVLSGHYQLRFTVVSGSLTAAPYYALNPQGGGWSRPETQSVYITPETVPFASGVSYTLEVSK